MGLNPDAKNKRPTLSNQGGMVFDIEEYLNSLPEDTIKINVSHKNLTYLPDLSRFKKLQTLNCSYNKLTALPKLNETLLELDCSFNNLTVLPTLNVNLQILDCSFNRQLFTLPEINKKLQELHCIDIGLTALPALNKKLEVLDCSENKLTILPQLNRKLQELYCRKNQITVLPTLNKKLQLLDCSENKLTTLPELNANLRKIDSSNNSKLPAILTIRTYKNQLSNAQRNRINRFIRCKYRIMCFKYRQHFRRWLWERVRLPKIERDYHPNNLIEKLDNMENPDDEEEFIKVIENW